MATVSTGETCPECSSVNTEVYARFDEEDGKYYRFRCHACGYSERREPDE